MSGLDSNTKLLLHANGVDGSYEVLDSGNTGHVVTQNGTAALQTSTKKWGSSALTLDGDSDYLSIPDSADWDITGSDSDDWTIDFWVKHASGSEDGSYATHYEDSDNRWYIMHVSGSGIRFAMRSGSSTVIDTGYAGAITDTDWHHIALCKVGDEYGIYKDGTQVSYTQDTSTDTFSGDLVIGQEGDDNSYFLNGHIDELRIQHSNIFSASPNNTPDDTITTPTSAHTSDANTHLLLHMNTQDVSGDGGSDSYHIPEFKGTAQLDTAAKKWGTASLLLDGDSDYLDIADSSDWDICGSSADNWTIDFWVKHDTHSGYEYYISQYEDADNRWALRHYDGAGIRFVAEFGGVHWAIDTGSGGEITDTNWHHIALCKVGSKWGIYKDGTQVAYTDDSSTDTLSSSLYIGARGTGSYYLDGHMDEVRIQHSNYFNASPNSTPDDTITVPTKAYSAAVKGYTQAIIIGG